MIADDEVRFPVPGWQPKKVLENLDIPIREEGEPCEYRGHPCILFGMCAEDWSGEYIGELHPFALNGAPRITVAAFWALVRRAHGVI